MVSMSIGQNQDGVEVLRPLVTSVKRGSLETEMKRGFSGPSIFLSHSHADNRFVRRLAKDLTQNGIRIWLDEAEMMVGDSLIEKISKAIDETDYVGVVLSKSSVKSRWVKKEVSIAMTKEIRGRQVTILPILLEDCNVPSYLSDRIYADFRNLKSYRQQLARIVVKVTTLPGSSATQVLPLLMTHTRDRVGIAQVKRTPAKQVEFREKTKLDQLQRLRDQEAIASFLAALTTDALLVLLDEMTERLSLVHSYEQFDTCRNFLTAIKLAPMSRDNDADRVRVFKRIQTFVASPERPLVGSEYFYGAILNSLDDLAIKQYVLRSGVLDRYVSDLGNATSFEDAKVRAKVLALFSNKLTKGQKKRIVSAIVKQSQVLESFGAQSALKSIVQTVRDQIPNERVKALREHHFLK
jgi:hypothetical protein